MPVRFFVSQETIAALVDSGKGTLDGETLDVPERHLKARVVPAVYVAAEIEGKGDPNALVGKVKTIETLGKLGADHYRDSLLVGETGYEVVEGFLGDAEAGWRWPDGAGGAGGAGASAPAPDAAAPEPAESESAAEDGSHEVADVMEMIILDTVKSGPKKGARKGKRKK